MDREFFIKNRNRLTEKLLPGSLAVFHSADVSYRNGDQAFPFRQNSDFYYLTGIAQERSVLILFPDCPNPALREVLFLIEPSDLLLTWEGHKYSAREATEVSGVAKVMWNGSFETVLAEAMSFAGQVYLNANEYAKFTTDVPYRDLRFAREIREKYPNHSYHRAAPLLSPLRTVKQPEELEKIRGAIALTGKAFERILHFVKPGVMEYQAEAEILHEFLFHGAAGPAYRSIIASGINACTLHYIENKDECHDGDLLLMDFGAECGHYAADITRTIPVNGKFSPRQKDCYNAVLRVLRQGGKLLRPGKTIDQVNKEVNRLMEAEMIGLGLFTCEDVTRQNPEKPLYASYFMHGVSHFLGLDVHDVGSKFEPLQPGMVLTFEPGLYIREENLGIRLENDFLVTEGDAADLAAEIPVEAEEIEAMMRRK
jgi:Xaa-Pro aminopeptidase